MLSVHVVCCVHVCCLVLLGFPVFMCFVCFVCVCVLGWVFLKCCMSCFVSLKQVTSLAGCAVVLLPLVSVSSGRAASQITVSPLERLLNFPCNCWHSTNGRIPKGEMGVVLLNFRREDQRLTNQSLGAPWFRTHPATWKPRRSPCNSSNDPSRSLGKPATQVKKGNLAAVCAGIFR